MRIPGSLVVAVLLAGLVLVRDTPFERRTDRACDRLLGEFRGKSAEYQVCGARSVRMRVTRGGAAARFTLQVQKP